MKKILRISSLLLFPLLTWGQDLSGTWDATVTANGLTIPFRFELETKSGTVAGSFFNGKDQYRSSSGTFKGASLQLDFDYYATTLKARLEQGELVGEYSRGKRIYPFRAKPHQAAKSNEPAPNIDGQWEIETTSAKGEKAWRFIVQQEGNWLSASILRIDGDTGALSGTYQDGKFTLSHFSGARPGLLEVRPNADGTLALKLNAKTELLARRPEAARAAGLAGPSDSHHFTTVKNTAEPLQFAAPDLNGKLVTNADPQFRGKVVLVNITGSWCPNCHDEAPFLAALYKKYKSQGLEIVALDFEEEEQLADPVRLRAFIKKHGIEYTVLLAGETSTAKEKLKQAENWNAWPTTFFVGRDGLVKGAHAGFPSNASGPLFEEAKREFTRTVEKLLAERQVSSR
jgi:thiol-disulfide isomerase/thioredoxin